MHKQLLALEQLLAFSLKHGLIAAEDVPWARNLLLDALHITLSEPLEEPYRTWEGDLSDTATPMLNVLCDHAWEAGILSADSACDRELFSARLMGLLTAPPSHIAREFSAVYRAQGSAAATAWFYSLCRHNDYIRVDAIAKNVIFESDSPVGPLTLTINLSKPEKDPRQIALERTMATSGYPRCMLCVENPGYAGRANFPARQNHRMIPLSLGGEGWHMQYSPYLYYNEHCIVLNDRHQPMRISEKTFVRMFDFIDRFPHYFIGSNADLPIVGGSILSHDHFQGGRHVFPMMKAPLARELTPPKGIATAGIVRWPLSAIRLTSADRDALIGQAKRILDAWRTYSDESMGILAHTDAPHNTLTPILRKEGEAYVMDLVLRNNRTSDEHPMGIYHPHADLHHIKRENIGLIEVMGLFILPGRLLEELSEVETALTTANMPATQAMDKHCAWIKELTARHGRVSPDKVQDVLRTELADKCARVLSDCGVYPQTDEGLTAMCAFLKTVGIG